MPSTRRMTGALASASLCLTILAPARAELPAALDRVPADALTIVATPSLSQLDRGASQLLGALEMPVMSTPAQILAVMGLAGNVDMNRSAAVALFADEMGAPTPIALIPTGDYAGLVGAFDASDIGDGVSLFSINGQDVYAKEIDGGFAAMGASGSVVAGFAGEAGHLAAHRAAIGPVGASIAENADFTTIVSRQMLMMLVEQSLAAMNMEQMGMAALMGGVDPEQLAQQMEQASVLLAALGAQTRAVVIGAKAGALGLGFDMAFTFDEGSDLRGAFGFTGRSGHLLDRLPNMPFLFAAAGDFSSPAIKEMFVAMAEGAGAGDLANLSDGQAVAVYENPNGLMAGLFANTVAFTEAKDAAGLLASMRTTMRGMNDMPGSPMRASYQESAEQIDGVAVDKWALTPDLGAAGGFGMQQQVMGMLFGPMGLGGYTALADGGVYQTYSQNKDLVRRSLGAGGDPLSKQAALRMVSAQLPDDRTAEAYVNLGSVVNQALTVAAMFLGEVDFNVPAGLPPVGMAMTTHSGTARVSVFTPAPVIKTTLSLYQQFQGVAGGGAGRPRF